MSRPMQKRTRVLLGVLLVVALVGACFASVAVYAKKEIAKPKFTMPAQPQRTYASTLPTEQDALYAYAVRQYAEALSADDAEGSWKTEVKLDGEWNTPMTGADAAAFALFRDRAAAEIASLYPSAQDVRLTQAADKPRNAGVGKADILSCRAQTRDPDQPDNAESAPDHVWIECTAAPSVWNTQSMEQSALCRTIRQKLSPAVEITAMEITAQSVRERYEIDRVTDRVCAARFTQSFRIRASIRLTDDYSALLPQPETQIELPYETVQTVTFRHYGARFTERAIAVRPGDRKALPADVTVSTQAADAYDLTFDASVQDVLSFDEDGVMTVKTPCGEPVVVTMTLRCAGHTYTDRLTVYITQLEVTSDD